MPLVFGSLFNCVYKHAKVSFRNNKKNNMTVLDDYYL